MGWMLVVAAMAGAAAAGFGLGVILAPEFYIDPRDWTPPPAREDE